MGTTLKVGILGAANIAKKNVRAIGLAAPSVEVTAVASRSLAKAQAFIADTGLKGKAVAYGSYDEMLQDGNVDAVYIALPSGLHREWVMKAAGAKKHVLCEKPISMVLSETEEMLEACRAAGVQFMDGSMWLHNPRTLRLRSLLDDEHTFGQLHGVVSTFTFLGDEAFLAGDVRVQPHLDGLGCLGDLGWYSIGWTLWAFRYQLPSFAAAHHGAHMTSEGVPLALGFTLGWADGRRATMYCSFDRPFTQHLEIAGIKQIVRLEDFVVPYQETRSGYWVSYQHGLGDGDTRVTTLVDEVQVNLKVPQETSMWEDFAGAVSAIREGGQPDPKWPQISCMTQRVVCAVEQSLRNGCQPVTL